MSNSRIIPRVRARGLRAWRPGEVSAASAAKPPPVPGKPDAAAVQRAELDRQRSAARQEGFESGLAEGRAAAVREATELGALLASLGELLSSVEQDLAADVLSLALEVSRQLVRQSLRVKPDGVLAIIREAALGFPALASGARLHLNPADASLVRGALAGQAIIHETSWMIVEDDQIERGGCRLVSGPTHVDATLQDRWRRIVAALGRDDAWLERDA